MRRFSIGATLVVLVGCGSRHALEGSVTATGGAGGTSGDGAGGDGAVGAGAGGGGADATPPVPLCARLAAPGSHRLTMLAQSGGELLFFQSDGSVARVGGLGAKAGHIERFGWVAVWDGASPTTWHVRLFDSSGALRADASGTSPLDAKGQPVGVRGLTILSDGTTTADLGTPSTNPILHPDGRVRLGPYYTTDTDDRGWTSTSLHSDTVVLGIPVFLNVETGEIRRLSRLAPDDGWAPNITPSRRVYLAEIDGAAVLVDESVDDVATTPLPGWRRADLEVDPVQRPDHTVGATVITRGAPRPNVPLWFYDPTTRALASALPDGTLPPDASAFARARNMVEVSVGGARGWAVDTGTGTIIDYRAGLAVRPAAFPTTAPPDWDLFADNQKNVFRLDHASGAFEDLHVAGDVAQGPNQRALVTRDGRPREVVHVDDGTVLEIADAEALAALPPSFAGRWAGGFESSTNQSWVLDLPRWRVDLETGAARLFAALDPPPMFSGIGTASRFGGGFAPLLPDGRAVVMSYDGYSFSLHVGGPDDPWQTMGEPVRAAERIGWAFGAGFLIDAEKDCSCYGPIQGPWPPAPAGAPAALSGTSLQLLGADGSTLFPPTTDEHFVAFADQTNSCALVSTDAGASVVYDLAAGRRRDLGKLDAIAWITDVP
jgi:hypothetical protein